MTDSTLPPATLLSWARRVLGAPLAVSGASQQRRMNSRVWELARGDSMRFFLKVASSVRGYERETFALRHAASALGGAAAPQLRDSRPEHLALLMTAVPGSTVDRLRLAGPQEYEAHRQAGMLLARLHAAGDLTGARNREASGAVAMAAAGAEKHLAAVGHQISRSEQEFVRGLARQLQHVPSLPLAFIHGDAQPRNLLWNPSSSRAGWIDFERARFGAAVQDFVPLACGTWVDRPDLRTALLGGYGRDLTPAEEHALTCLSAVDAVNCLAWGPAADDPDVTARGRRTLNRLMTGAHV